MTDVEVAPRRPFSMSRFLARARIGRFPFVFVVTYGRSGSTLLLGLLNALYGYRIRGENRNALFHLYRASHAVKYAKQRWGAANKPSHPWYGASELDPARFRARIVETFVDEVLAPRDEDLVIGLKEIRHTPDDMTDSDFDDYLAFLREAFPGCGLIFNVRNPAGSAASGFFGKREDRTKTLDTISATRVRLEKAAAGEADSILFEYDEWMRDIDYAERLFEFLGETYEPATVGRIVAERHGLK